MATFGYDNGLLKCLVNNYFGLNVNHSVQKIDKIVPSVPSIKVKIYLDQYKSKYDKAMSKSQMDEPLENIYVDQIGENNESMYMR